jgi:hypothetical protein
LPPDESWKTGCRLLQQVLTALFRRKSENPFPFPIMFDPRAGRDAAPPEVARFLAVHSAASAPSLALAAFGSAIRGPSVCGSNRIGLERAAPAERLVRLNRRILRGLMLDLGVELSAEQDHDHRDPHPHHHADSRA